MSELGLSILDEVSNDLRSPLTVVKGCVETVLANWDELDRSERDELLGAALNSAEELVVSVEALEARLQVVDDGGVDAPRPDESISLDGDS
jgi:K+-sensing histidine kinase KdpD